MENKEIIEEAAKNYAHNYFEMQETNHYKSLKQGFEAGAKWQQERNEEALKEATRVSFNLGIDKATQERSYSDEEIGLLNKMFELYWYENNSQHPDNLEEWELSKKIIEQFKKK